MKDSRIPSGHGGDAQSLMATARLLARRGRFGEASEWISTALARGECTEEEALDLQARIHAQQGQLLQAEACWRRAQSLNQENTEYADALAALRQSRRPFATWWRSAVGSGIAILLLLQLGVMVARQRADARDREILERRLAHIEQDISALRGDVDGAATATANKMAPLARTVDVEAGARRTAAGMQRDLDHLRKESAAADLRSREAVLKAITSSEARLEAKLAETELRLESQLQGVPSGSARQ